MERIRIEGLKEGGSMGPARKIFQTEGIALAVVGSPACVRSLYFVAEELGRTEYFFWRSLTPRDYSLGRHEGAIRECVREALCRPCIKGVIIYASCMDILACLELEEILLGVANPREVPVEILYRGPLAKRREPPMEALEKILQRWEKRLGDGFTAEKERSDGEASLKTVPRTVLSHAWQQKTLSRIQPPEAPEFEKIIKGLEHEDCDILLLTPGGCKSCLAFQREEAFQRVKNTRFSDISICSGDVEALVEPVLEAFPEERPLVILGSAVMDAMGFDYEGLFSRLRENKIIRERNETCDDLIWKTGNFLGHMKHF